MLHWSNRRIPPFDSRRHATDVQSLVHNRLIEGLRAGLGRGRARARRPGGRDGAQRRHADPARRGLRRQRPRPPARRQRQGGDRRRGPAGARALRPPRRRRQQRRLRALRRDRRDHGRAGAPADRDQPVRPAVGHAGRAPDHARAGRRPHHPGLVDRRRERVPDPRALPRVEVGPGGLQPVACGRGRRVRHQGHDRRARRVLDRLARPVGGRGAADGRVRRGARLPRAAVHRPAGRAG